MKIIGIVCSPRKGGNTEILISRALEGAREAGAEETAMILLADKHINPCDACGACLKTGECHQKDDMRDIYVKLLDADGIIIGTPVYFWGVSAQAKALMDRTYCLAFARRAILSGNKPASESRMEGLRNKVGGMITVARRGGASSTIRQISDFYRIHRIIEAGAAIAYAQQKGEVSKDEQGLREAWWLGRAVVRMVNQLQAGKTRLTNSKVPQPEK